MDNEKTNSTRAVEAFNDYCDNFSTEGLISYDITEEAFEELIRPYGFSYRSYDNHGFAMYDTHGKGIVDGDTEDSMNMRISDFYQSLRAKVDTLGYETTVKGRCGAWWGIRLETADPKEVFKLSDESIVNFNDLADEDSMDDDYELIQSVIDDNENSLVLTDSFIECMQVIKDSIESTNEKWQAGNFDESMTFFNKKKPLKENKMVEQDDDSEAVSLTVDAVTDRYTEDEINDMDPDDLYEACFEAACNYLDENYKQYYTGVGEAAYNALEAGETSSPNKGVNEVLKALTEKFNEDELNNMSSEDLKQACQMTASGYTDEYYNQNSQTIANSAFELIHV